ncbi:MAG: hypothetical protein H0X31_17445 [Nostocaceae cyanobacterium]|nr:hypothetical protein [Nostocaceae cyanobacterium]
MSAEKKTNSEDEKSLISPEVLDKIKHPPAMDQVLRDMPPLERRSDPSLVPEALDDEQTGEMDAFTRD